MEIKNDEWIAKIQDLEKEISVFQESGAGTEEAGNGLRSLTMARLWLEEDKRKNIPSLQEVSTTSPAF
jgi:hypothetical protein